MPSSSAYAHRFGGLTQAYKLIGYDPGRDLRYIDDNKHLRKMYPDVVEGVIRRIQSFGGVVNREVENDFLIVNGEIKVSLVICRCAQTQTGGNRWKIQFDASLMPDITIAVRMEADNRQILDYYLIPAIDVEDPKIRLAENNHLALDAYRFDSLEQFFMLAERAALPEAA